MKEIKPHLLDIVKRDSDYVLYYDGRPLLTPIGKEVAHHNLRILEHINRELCVSGQLYETDVAAYTLFTMQDCFVRGDIGPLTQVWDTLLEMDPLIRSKFESMASPIEDLDAFLEILGDQQQQLGFFFGGITGTLKSFNEFLIQYTEGKVSAADITYEGLSAIMLRAYKGMKPAQQAVVSMLSHVHQAGIILPMLLLLARITPSEYANTLFTIHMPGPEDDDSFSKDGFSSLPVACPVFLPDWKQPEPSFRQLRDQAFRSLEFLSCFEYATEADSTVQELIRAGEGFNVEFKSSLRWNIRAGKKDPAIEHAVLKTISAFLNSSGGTLFIGVRDDGSAAGLERDQFANDDKFALHFWNLIKASMGQDVSPFIQASFETHEDELIFMAQCTKSSRPIFLRHKGFDEEFFIRVGPSSAKLTIAEALKYISGRFSEN